MKKLILFVLAVIVFGQSVFAAEYIFIPWAFEVYTEPDFRAAPVGRFGAQSVAVLNHADNDWAMVQTADGEGWVNLRHAPAMCVLDEYFAPLGRNISVFYKNLDTGFTYIYNPDRVFFGASLSKSNHALYTFMLAERGYIDMYQVHIYSPADEWGGTGVLRFGPFGIELTTRDLLGLSIRESDNAAFRMLVRMTANQPFSYHNFVSEIGADSRLIRDILAQNVHARDAGLFMYHIFNYIEGESRYGHYLKYDMLNTAQTSHPHWTRWYGSNGLGDDGWGTYVNIRMLQSDYPLARKYGWSGGAFHDAGIIYAPSPYILVILSNKERGAHDIFADISWFMQDFNQRSFVSPTPLNAPHKGPEPYNGQSAYFAPEENFRLSVPVFAEYFLEIADV